MSRFRRRVERLERIVAARPPAPCAVCGTPRGYIAGFVIRGREGQPIHPECCPGCGIETHCGRVVGIPIDPRVGGCRDILIVPAGSAPLPV